MLASLSLWHAVLVSRRRRKEGRDGQGQWIRDLGPCALAGTQEALVKGRQAAGQAVERRPIEPWCDSISSELNQAAGDAGNGRRRREEARDRRNSC